jgi:hypothetical protein
MSIKINQDVVDGIVREKILDGLHSWCEWNKDDGCAMHNTRYDNCLCDQQCHSIMENLQKVLA